MKTTFLWYVFWVSISIGAASNARVTQINGSASCLREGTEKWRTVSPQMPLKNGDKIYTRKESFIEITLPSGGIIRLNENTKIVLENILSKDESVQCILGDVWINMKKLVSKKAAFSLSSPTATASIRGTVFSMNAQQDSSTDVAVYEGKVDVGLTKNRHQNSPPKAPSSSPGEIAGPSEIPGPFEVTLDQWRKIVAGQKISVRSDGTFAETKFNPQKEAENDAFVKFNQTLDKKLESMNTQEKKAD